MTVAGGDGIVESVVTRPDAAIEPPLNIVGFDSAVPLLFGSLPEFFDFPAVLFFCVFCAFSFSFSPIFATANPEVFLPSLLPSFLVLGDAPSVVL